MAQRPFRPTRPAREKGRDRRALSFARGGGGESRGPGNLHLTTISWGEKASVGLSPESGRPRGEKGIRYSRINLGVTLLRRKKLVCFFYEESAQIGVAKRHC